MKENFLNKDMKKTLLKIHILHRIKRSKVNSYSLLKEISSNSHSGRFFKNKAEIKNEVYNTINSLEKSGYIESSRKVESGRLKNFYAPTEKGTEVLKSAKVIFLKNMKELVLIMKE